MALTKEQIEEYKRRLIECEEEFSMEDGHKMADGILVEILCKLGYKEIVKLYAEVGKWYA